MVFFGFAARARCARRGASITACAAAQTLRANASTVSSRFAIRAFVRGLCGVCAALVRRCAALVWQWCLSPAACSGLRTRPVCTLPQAMVQRCHAHALIIGASIDLVFGPVMLFGQGAAAVQLVADRALALAPLNSKQSDCRSRHWSARRLALCTVAAGLSNAEQVRFLPDPGPRSNSGRMDLHACFGAPLRDTHLRPADPRGEIKQESSNMCTPGRQGPRGGPSVALGDYGGAQREGTQ